MSFGKEIRSLTKQDANGLLEQHDCPTLNDLENISFKEVTALSLGEKSPKLPQFIDDLVRAMHTSDTLFIALEWGIWPSSEVPGLFDEARGFDKNSGSQVEFPGELVGTNESDHIVKLSKIAAKFGWGFALVNLGKKSTFLFTHDSWFTFEVTDDELWSKIVKILDTYQPREFVGFDEIDVDYPVLSGENGQALIAQISSVLRSHWNPLSMKIWEDAPDDEYDNYVLPVIGIMQRGGAADEVIAYLMETERERMSQEPVVAKCQKAADLCLAAYCNMYPND